jgi:hypothetical protein
MRQKRSENRLYELLHIDAENSQKFFVDHKATDSEKCDCQKALSDSFTGCCRRFGGMVKFQGDGGIAYFDVSKFSGGSVRAAEKFFGDLPKLHKQTERLLPGRKVRRQRFRLKAHFGSIYFHPSGRHEASAANVIDSLVKEERNIAPLTEQLYITEDLLRTLSPELQARFARATTRKQQFGHLSTVVYRLHKRPPDTLPRPPALKGKRVGGRRTDITTAELNFLKRSLETQVRLTTARNLITTSLTKRLATSKRAIRGTDLVEATLQGIHAFLVSSCGDVTETFNVTFWRPNRIVQPTHLRKQLGFPRPGPPRTISLREEKYQCVRSFTECTAIFHEDVRAAAANREWIPFDSQQAKQRRNLFSAAQFPIYRNKNAVGKRLDQEVLGVLSIDTNCPEFFHPEDATLWIDRVKGFLVNLALSQVLEQQR